jgi:hypothetical protein
MQDETDIKELSDLELDLAISAINELIREPFHCIHGEYPMLDRACSGSWIQELEQTGSIEIPAYYTQTKRPEQIKRESLKIGGSR